MIYALDTNTLSYGMREQGGVAEKLRSMGPANLALPSMVVFETRFGLLRAKRLRLLEAFDITCGAMRHLEFDAEAANHAARIRVELEAAGTPIGLADLLIAATARRHGCTLVTHNTSEFSRINGLALDDWY